MKKNQYGTITRWENDKGFGFIDNEQGQSLFFHISEFTRSERPNVGNQVSFTTAIDKKGRLQAQKVAVIQPNSVNKSGSLNHSLNKNDSKNSAKNKAKNKAKKDLKNKRIRRRQPDFQERQRRQLFLAIGMYTVLIVCAIMGTLNWAVVGWYVIIGLVTFGVYAKDKEAARKGAWRTPESTLHLLSVLGGWVGAMMAQNYLRHKSTKVEFRTVFYMTVLINLAILLAIIFKFAEVKF